MKKSLLVLALLAVSAVAAYAQPKATTIGRCVVNESPQQPGRQLAPGEVFGVLAFRGFAKIQMNSGSGLVDCLLGSGVGVAVKAATCQATNTPGVSMCAVPWVRVCGNDVEKPRPWMAEVLLDGPATTLAQAPVLQSQSQTIIAANTGCPDCNTRLDKLEGSVAETDRVVGRVIGVVEKHDRRLTALEGTVVEHTQVLNDHDVTLKEYGVLFKKNPDGSFKRNKKGELEPKKSFFETKKGKVVLVLGIIGGSVGGAYAYDKISNGGGKGKGGHSGGRPGPKAKNGP